MASAVKTLTRTFPRSATRIATHSSLPQQLSRSSVRCNYSSGSNLSSPYKKSLYASAAAVAGLGAGGYFYLSSKDEVPELYLKKGSAGQSQGLFKPTQKDYQGVYNAIAHELVENDNYDDGSYGPVLVRLAWHASGTYDAETRTGGSNGATMRFPPEGDHGANSGLRHARDFLQPVKEQYPWISYSDLWTLAGVCAIQEMQRPIIPWRPGRQDRDIAHCTPDGRLPDGARGKDHIRAIFGRMGFDDREMVALSGAHSLGKFCSDVTLIFRLLMEEKWGWRNWNGPKQYQDKTKQLMMLPSDMALVKDHIFKTHVERYVKDSQVFFREFSDAAVKLFELGVPFKSKPGDRIAFQPTE